MENPALAAQIPAGAHIFHGAYDDGDLTQENLQLATNTLLGMTLGFVEEAPLMMLFEYQPDQETLIDLSSEEYKKSAQLLVQSFREKNQQALNSKIDKLVAV